MFPPETKILIVDDMKGIRVWLAKSLETLGYSHISEAANGEEALAYLKAHPVDLIFTDLIMPVMGGIDFIREVQKNDKLAKVPMIALTAESDKNMILQVIGMGVSSYIIKPATLPILQKKMEAVFNSKKG